MKGSNYSNIAASAIRTECLVRQISKLFVNAYFSDTNVGSVALSGGPAGGQGCWGARRVGGWGAKGWQAGSPEKGRRTDALVSAKASVDKQVGDLAHQAFGSCATFCYITIEKNRLP